MRRYLTLILSVLTVLMIIQITSCNKDQAPVKQSACTFYSDTTHIRYVSDTSKDPYSILYIVISSCSFQSGCHEQGSINGDYTTYEGIKQQVDNGTLYNRVVVERTMPPTYSYIALDSCQIREFYLWIKEGGPEY